MEPKPQSLNVPTGIGSQYAGRNLGSLSASELRQLRDQAQASGRGDLAAAIDAMALPAIMSLPAMEIPTQPAPPALDCPEKQEVNETCVNEDLPVTEE